MLERVWSRPTLEVHGIAGGFTAAGAKTVIPAKATAKVSLRLVPTSTRKKLSRVQRFVQKNAPAGVRRWTCACSARRRRVMVNPDHPAISTAARVFGEMLGRPTVFIRSGGSMPIVGDFAKHLGIPTVMMGFGLPDDGLHSPNEKYSLSNYYTGIMTIAHFFEQYGR